MSVIAKKRIKDAVIIIQACNKNELHACLEEIQLEGDTINVVLKNTKMFLGTFAKYPCALVSTE